MKDITVLNVKFIVLHSIILLLITSCSSTNKATGDKSQVSYSEYNNLSTPQDIYNKNKYRRGLEEGKNAGYEIGHIDGYEDGYNNGLAEGKRIGYDIGYEEGEEKGRYIGFTKCEKFEDFIDYKYERCEEEKKLLNKQVRKEAFNDARSYIKKLTFDTVYKSGFEAGYKARLEELVMGEADTLNVRDIKFTPSFDYEEVLSRLTKPNGDVSDKSSFGEALNMIHYDILTSVIKQLNLPPEVKKEAIAQYNRIHDKYTNDYYELYKETYKQSYLNKLDTFNYYTDYHAAKIFTSVISTGICSLVDVVLSYARMHPLFSLATGLVANQLCQTVVTNLITPLEDELTKFGIFKSYNRMIVQLNSETREYLNELVVVKETFQERVKKEESAVFLFIFRFYAAVEMDVTTTIFYGFNVDDIHLSVDHELEEIIVDLPPLKQIEKPYQSFEIIDVQDLFLGNLVDAEFLNEMFRRVKYMARMKANMIEASRYEYISSMGKDKAVEALRKMYFPIIAIPESYYNVCVNYNGERIYLFKDLARN